MEDLRVQVKSLIVNIVSLSQGLPATVPIATKGDKIYSVMTSAPGESTWHTFNRRFDALFGEDCRDQHGRLHFICRGLYGMDKVCSYLESIDLTASDLPLDLIKIKLERLNNEILFLGCVIVRYA
jgi:hypothetical protein